MKKYIEAQKLSELKEKGVEKEIKDFDVLRIVSRLLLLKANFNTESCCSVLWYFKKHGYRLTNLNVITLFYLFFVFDFDAKTLAFIDGFFETESQKAKAIHKIMEARRISYKDTIIHNIKEKMQDYFFSIDKNAKVNIRKWDRKYNVARPV